MVNFVVAIFPQFFFLILKTEKKKKNLPKGTIPALREMTAQWEERHEINRKGKIQLYIELL